MSLEKRRVLTGPTKKAKPSLRWTGDDDRRDPQNVCEAKFWGGRVAGRTRPGYNSTEPVRGYTKLSDAARAFGFDFRDKTVLDIGSSTGGFTKYALDHGAKKVIAIEKGTNQMMSPLRYDKRIDLHEKTDIFDLKLEPRSIMQSAPDIIVADVSFISLKKVLKHASLCLTDKHTNYLVMMKPQFEARPNQLNRGVVKNEAMRRDIIKDFEYWLKQNGFVVVKKRDNELTGKTGNKERFYWLLNIKSNN